MNAALIGSIIYNYYYKNEDDKMTDHKFADAEIVKALECCNTPGSCYKCPYYDEDADAYEEACKYFLIKDVFPLINRQKSEIERLQAVHADMTESLRLASEANKDMQAELEDLREIVFMDRSEAIKNLKAETIKEFAQRLKRRARMPLGTLYGGMVYLKDIDNLVKIMTEDNNESQNT